jgi:hypothetical protein
LLGQGFLLLPAKGVVGISTHRPLLRCDCFLSSTGETVRFEMKVVVLIIKSGL